MWEILEFGDKGVIVTAPFVKKLFEPNWIENFSSDCQKMEAVLTIVWIHCDKEILRERIASRGSSRDDWKLENWFEWASSLKETFT